MRKKLLFSERKLYIRIWVLTNINIITIKFWIYFVKTVTSVNFVAQGFQEFYNNIM